MARLLFTNRLEDFAKRLTWLRDLLWRLESWVVAALLACFRLATPTAASRIGQALVALLGPISAKHKLVLDNVDVAFAELDPSERVKIAGESWRSVGALFGEMTQFRRMAANESGARLEVVSHCDLEPYRNRQRSGIFCGAHIANWEALLLAFTVERIPALAFYAPLQNPHLGRLLAKIRATTGCVMYNRDASLKPVIRHLRDGGSIGTLADVRVDGGLRVPLFGHPMQVSPIPARLALRYGCDLIPYQCQRLGDCSLRVTIHEPVSTQGLEGDEDAQLTELATRHMQQVESWIRDAPGSWLMTTRRWERPLYRRTKGGPPMERA